MAVIIIVNWNGWRDTVACLDSVFALTGFSGNVIVTDNGSTDDSVLKIQAWQAQRAPANFQLLEMPRNLGFAAGNNVGLRWALSHTSADIFWFLNNDAIALPDAYVYLSEAFHDSNIPLMAGSVLLEYTSPDLIQACGGSFNNLTLRVAHLMAGQSVAELEKCPRFVPVDYPVGASLAVNRAWIDRVGEMSEVYFIYYEELDWVIRARLPDPPVIATRSRVLHKGGASTGGPYNNGPRSLLADRFHVRGRLILAGRIGPMAFLRALIISLLILPKRLCSGRVGAGSNALRAIADGVRVAGAEWNRRA